MNFCTTFDLGFVPWTGFDAARVRHFVLERVRPGDRTGRHTGVVVETVPEYIEI